MILYSNASSISPPVTDVIKPPFTGKESKSIAMYLDDICGDSPTDPFFNDVSQLEDCKLVDPPEYLYSEWSRYKALIAKEKLDYLVKNLKFTDDKNYLMQELRLAIRDIEKAVFELSDTSEGQLSHFSDVPLTGLIPD